MTERKKLFYRFIFIFAGFYNILWGSFAILKPQWFFKFFDLEPINHPEIFACLGMVVGIYGLLYFEVARRPSEGFAIAAIGLLGKLFGPIGWLRLYMLEEWPIESIVLILTNDLIWWIPFMMYLKVVWPVFLGSPNKL